MYNIINNITKMKKIVYIHSIKDVPFYVGSGDKKRAYDRIGRSDAWKDIVNSNKNEYDIEIVFSGDIIECLEIENEYIKKYWDTICNSNEAATSASHQFSSIILFSVLKCHQVCSTMNLLAH